MSQNGWKSSLNILLIENDTNSFFSTNFIPFHSTCVGVCAFGKVFAVASLLINRVTLFLGTNYISNALLPEKSTLSNEALSVFSVALATQHIKVVVLDRCIIEWHSKRIIRDTFVLFWLIHKQITKKLWFSLAIWEYFLSSERSLFVVNSYRYLNCFCRLRCLSSHDLFNILVGIHASDVYFKVLFLSVPMKREKKPAVSCLRTLYISGSPFFIFFGQIF